MATGYTDRLGGATPAAGPLGAQSRCRVATTANISIASALNNSDVLDGVVLVNGDLVLVKDQASPAENGVYVVGDSPARYQPFSTWDSFPGQWFTVQEGTTYADTTWLCTSNGGGTIDTTALAFTQFATNSVAAQIIAASAKTTPVDADTMPLIDSAASSALKQVTWANIKATLKAYFDTLYAPIGAIAASLLTTRGDIIYRDASAPARLPKGTSGQVLTMGANDPAWATPSSTAYPPGHIFGLGMSNAADATNDITVAVGSARNEGNTTDLTLAGSITKQIDAAWAVGTNAGGLNTGAVANSTWYEVHLIRRSDTGVVDVMFTTTANRATLPTSYDSQRRIGWVRRGTATNLAFTQVEDWFTLTTQINDAAATISTTAAQLTLTVPPSAIARLRGTIISADDNFVLSEIVEGNVSPSPTTGILSLASGFEAAGHFELRVSASSQIEIDSEAAGGGTYDISTYGWIDTRGRLV